MKRSVPLIYNIEILRVRGIALSGTEPFCHPHPQEENSVVYLLTRNVHYFIDRKCSEGNESSEVID